MEQKVTDQRYMDLYWKLVKAGYVEKGMTTTPELSVQGVPQGSLLSPLLSNIYLNELDCFMEEYIEANSSKAHLIKVNPKMANLTKKISALHKKEVDRNADTLKELRAIRQHRNTLPSRIRTGVRIHYVRYADD